MTRARNNTPDQLEILFAMFEHEVRTPLSALVGFTDLLRPDMDTQELRELVPRIRSNARLLCDVVDGLSGVGEWVPGRPIAEETPLCLVDLLGGVIDASLPEADRKQLDLTLDVDPRVPSSVLGARGRLHVVLRNLVANAIKFTDHGQVSLATEYVCTSNSRVRLRYSVADTGRGIRAEHRETILEPFGRVEEISTTPGSGLGLSICDRLIRALGSKIEITSRPGVGSTFSFELTHELPLGTAVTSAEESAGVTEGFPEAARVLIVDDDADHLELLDRLVRREGFATDIARDGHTALAKVGRRAYAIVLTDLHMSGMDGVELSRRLRERGSRTTTLVAVTASRLLRGDIGVALQEAFDQILLKPIRPRVLSNLLAPYRSKDKRPTTERAAPGDEPVDTSVVAIAANYLARRMRDVEVLRAFLAGRVSFEDVSKIGHNLKGTAASYELPTLGRLGAALEDAAQALEVDRIAQITDSIESIVRGAIAERETSEIAGPRPPDGVPLPVRRGPPVG